MRELTHKKHRRPLPPWVRRLVLAVTGIVLLIGGWIFCVAAYQSLEAEETLHSTNLVVSLIEEYVSENQGQWPKSWEVLKEVRSQDSRWPEDADDIMSRVSVDFSADPDELVKQSVEEFDAIKPIGPNYGISQVGCVKP
jgi:hypothetical protein